MSPVLRPFFFIGFFLFAFELPAQKTAFSPLLQVQSLELKPLSSCSDWSDLQLRFALQSLEQNESEKALLFALSVRNGEPDCPQGHQTTAWCLFRNGQRRAGMHAIDSAILRFGPYPELLGRRALMAYEMGSTGLFQAWVDGRSQYQGNPAPWSGPDSSFRSTCLNLALSDFSFMESAGFADTAEFLMLARLHVLNKNPKAAWAYLRKSGPPYEAPDCPVLLQTLADLGQIDSLVFWARQLQFPDLKTVRGCTQWAALVSGIWPDSARIYVQKADFLRRVWLGHTLSFNPTQADFIQQLQGKLLKKSLPTLQRSIAQQPSPEHAFWWLQALCSAPADRFPDLAGFLSPHSDSLWNFLQPTLQQADSMPERVQQFFGFARNPAYWNWAVQQAESWGLQAESKSSPWLASMYLHSPETAARCFLRWLARPSWVQRRPIESLLSSVLPATEIRRLAQAEGYSTEQIQQLLSRLN